MCYDNNDRTDFKQHEIVPGIVSLIEIAEDYSADDSWRDADQPVPDYYYMVSTVMIGGIGGIEVGSSYLGSIAVNHNINPLRESYMHTCAWEMIAEDRYTLRENIQGEIARMQAKIAKLESALLTLESDYIAEYDTVKY